MSIAVVDDAGSGQNSLNWLCRLYCVSRCCPGGKYVLPLARFDVWDILTLAWLGNGTRQNTLVADVSRNLFSTENG